MHLKNEVLREVGVLGRCVQAVCDTKFRALQLQRGQFIFLARICEIPGIHPQQLALLLKVDKATVTKAVQKLVAAGYIRKEANPEDQRSCCLHPEDKGWQAYEEILAEENENVDCCLQGLSANEQKMLVQLLRRLNENMEERWKAIKQ